MSRDVRGVGVGPEVAAAHAPSGRLDTLEDVLLSGAHVIDVIVQDEYTHDVIATRGAMPGFLVFDTT